MTLVAIAWLAAPLAYTASIVRAEQAIRRAEATRFQIAVTVCGDAGRQAELRRLVARQRDPESQFHKASGRWAINEVVLDDRHDCEDAHGFRRLAMKYDAALIEARTALGD